MDTFWGSGSVEGRAASFLLNFLVGQCRITQCQGRAGGSTVQRGGCREELFVSTISDALGRYWQEEDDERTRGQNKKGEIFCEKRKRGDGLIIWGAVSCLFRLYLYLSLTFCILSGKDWSSGGWLGAVSYICRSPASPLFAQSWGEEKGGSAFVCFRSPLFVCLIFHHISLFVCFVSCQQPEHCPKHNTNPFTFELEIVGTNLYSTICLIWPKTSKNWLYHKNLINCHFVFFANDVCEFSPGSYQGLSTLPTAHQY